MPLDISAGLRSPGDSFPFRQEVTLEPQQVMGDTITFKGPVVLEGQFCVTDRVLHLWGDLTATAQGHCANCLEPASYPVRVAFSEVFFPAGQQPREESDQPDDLDRFAYDGQEADLHPMALTLAVLELPIRMLCKPDCDGPHGELRKKPTQHADQEDMLTAHPFSALRQLLNKDQEV